MAAKTAAKGLVLALLARSPDGLYTSQIAMALDMSETRASSATNWLAKEGMVIGVRDGMGKATQRRRWCVPQHETTCRAAVQGEAIKPAPWKRTGLGRVGQAAAPALHADVKWTRAEPFVDRRYTPSSVERFFSAIGPGRYMPSDSAIERAYAERDTVQSGR